MSLDTPPYLFSLQNNIRARPIPWEGAVRAGTITDGNLKTIKAVDKVRKDQRKQIVEDNLDGYKDLIVGDGDKKSVLALAAKRTDVVQYMLVLVGDLIDECPSLGPKILAAADPYKSLLPHINDTSKPEDPIPLLTSAILSNLASIDQSSSSRLSATTSKALEQLFSHDSKLTQSHDGGLKDIAVLQYSTVLKTEGSRRLFWDKREITIGPLIEILREASGSAKDGTTALASQATGIKSATENGAAGGVGLQLLYHVLLVIWQLSFEADRIALELEREYGLIGLYAQLLRLSPKEKTTRLLLATLRNLLSSDANKSLLSLATLARLPTILSNTKARHLTDEDLLEDLKFLVQILDEYTNSQTTVDEYAAEVNSGHLHWSPPHRDAKFWHENARKIVEDNDSAIPRKLAEILKKPWEGEKVQLAIACNDVGWMVKEAPEQRARLEKLGMKLRVMELMQDENEGVRWESLRAVGEWMRYSFEG